MADGTIFFVRRTNSNSEGSDIHLMEMVGGEWTPRRSAPFDSPFREGDFTVAPDGVTLGFTSNRPLPGEESPTERSNIWFTEVTDGEWSDPLPFPSPVNTPATEAYPSLTTDRTVYFFGLLPGGLGMADVYRSRFRDGEYEEVENLGPVINTEHEEWDPFISPDESFLLFCSTKPGGFGRDDLYVSFRREDGSWTEPVNLGEEVNSHTMDNRPYITADGRYLFYVSGRSGNRDVYWVDSRYLDRFRPADLR